MTATATAARATAVGIVLVFLAAVGFSIKAVLIKVAYGYGVDATTLLALRMLLSAPFFVALAIWQGRSSPPTQTTRRDWLHLGVLGFTGYYLASWLDFLGLQYITAGLERLVLFLYPTLVVLLSAWLLRERIRRHHVLALGLSYAGIGLVFVEQIRATGAHSDLALGGGLVFASAVVYSFYLIGSSRVIHRFGAVRFTAWAMLIASVVAIGQFAATHPLAALDLPMPVYGLSLTMAIFATVLPAVFMSEGLRRIGANRAALVGSIGPVVTLLLGAIFLGEPLGWLQITGSALVLTGVMIVSVRQGAVE